MEILEEGGGFHCRNVHTGYAFKRSCGPLYQYVCKGCLCVCGVEGGGNFKTGTTSGFQATDTVIEDGLNWRKKTDHSEKTTFSAFVPERFLRYDFNPKIN